MAKFRYTILLDRYEDEDWGPLQASQFPQEDQDKFHDGSDKAAISQVAAELQEAMDQYGLPVGFFNIVSRIEVDNEEKL